MHRSSCKGWTLFWPDWICCVQDAGKRAGIDKDLEKARYEEYEAEELRQQEVARQWRVARGEANAEDLQGPKRAGPVVREEWITVLPASRRPSAPSQKSQASQTACLFFEMILCVCMLCMYVACIGSQVKSLSIILLLSSQRCCSLTCSAVFCLAWLALLISSSTRAWFIPLEDKTHKDAEFKEILAWAKYFRKKVPR